MKLAVRVIETVRVFICCDVITKNKVKLEKLTAFSCNRCDGVVRLALGFCEDVSLSVGITSPRSKNFIRKRYEAFL